MNDIFRRETFQQAEEFVRGSIKRRPISGAYKNKNPASDNTVLEMRVDVDGRRPQMRISGDIFKQYKLKIFDDFIMTPGQQLYPVDQFQNLLSYSTAVRLKNAKVL